MAVIDPALAEAAGKAVRTAYPVTMTSLPVQAPASTVAVDPAKVAQLKAGAQAGSAGIDAFKSAQAAIDAQQAQAVKDAQARAAIIGGPEAQGFESIPNEFYTRAKAGLAASGAAHQNLQAQNRAAFDKYFGQLKGDMGAINDYIKNTLGSYEAKKRSAAEKAAAAKGFDTEVLGQTSLDLKEAATQRDALKSELDKAIADANAANPATDTRDSKVGLLESQRHAIQDKMARDTKEYYSSGTSAARKSAIAAELDKNKQRLAKVEGLERNAAGERNATATAAQQKVADLQAKYDQANALASMDPAEYAQKIAAEKYGYTPQKAAGKFTPDKFVPKQGTALDTQKYGADAVGLAQKLDIKGGAAQVRKYLDDTEVQDDLATLTDWSQGGKYTLDDAKKELGKQYLTTKKPEDRDKYNILIEMTYRLPWKSGRK